MSPTFLWVSKFDVNLGVKSKFSKSLCVGDFSIFGSKKFTCTWCNFDAKSRVFHTFRNLI